MTYPESSRDLEASEADAAEQAAPADPGSAEEEPPQVSSSIEAPEWDAQEQSRIVELEDDYR